MSVKMLVLDPFIGRNSQGVIFAQTPCWSVLAMPVPTTLLRETVEAGGGVYVGVQRVEEGEDLVLFNSRKTGSTLALKESKTSAENVARHIALHDDKWARMCDGGESR